MIEENEKIDSADEVPAASEEMPDVEAHDAVTPDERDLEIKRLSDELGEAKNELEKVCAELDLLKTRRSEAPAFTKSIPSPERNIASQSGLSFLRKPRENKS